MTEEKVEEKVVHLNIPEFDATKAEEVLKTIFLQTMGLMETLDYVENSSLKIYGKDFYKHKLKATGRAFMKEIENTNNLFHKFYSNTNDDTFTALYQNEFEFNRIMGIVPALRPEQRTMLGVIAAIMATDEAKWNVIKAQIIGSKILY